MPESREEFKTAWSLFSFLKTMDKGPPRIARPRAGENWPQQP